MATLFKILGWLLLAVLIVLGLIVLSGLLVIAWPVALVLAILILPWVLLATSKKKDKKD